jgi:hypothetical protein
MASKTTDYLERHPERKIYYAYLRLKSQAKFRGEPFALSEEDFMLLWKDKIQHKGRAKGQLRMTRLDRDKPWCLDNIIIGTQQDIDLYYNTRRTK